MKPSPLDSLRERAVVTAVPKTLADLTACVRHDPRLLPARQRDLASAIRRLCDWSRRDALMVPASHRLVAGLFDALHWKQVGVSRKTFQNTRSSVRFALDRYVRLERSLSTEALREDWRAARDRLPEGELRYRLSRLIGFCNSRGIPPEAVDDDVFAVFSTWLVEGTLVTHPRRLARAINLAWNKTCRTVPDWPGHPLPPPRIRELRNLPWDQLPEGLRRDAEAWLARNADPDPFDEDAPLHAWSERTLATRRFGIRQLVSAFHRSGRDLAQLDSLADLVEPDAAKAALRALLEANGGKTSSQIADLTAVLTAIAEHWVKVDPDKLKTLKRFKAQLSYRRTGLTRKNRERLHQFTDKRALIRFLSLPQAVLARVRRKKTLDTQDARELQVAVALEILLMAPFRRRNIVMIQCGKHLRWIGRGQERQLLIAFPAEEVKNRIDLDFRVPQETAELIDVYISLGLPVLSRHPGDWLFPGDRPDTHKHPDHFGSYFTTTVRRLTGLTVNMHLMRHLGALLYLDRNPGAYEVIRRVLGHKRLSTTVNSYTGAETAAAIRHFDEVILRLRSETMHEGEGDA